MSSFDIGLAGAVYVAGACLGALFFGQLTDRFGRKKLFLLTLGVYTFATVLTAFAPNPMWYFVARFITGMGIGGEYAAINSAIDELIPKHYRGRVDVAINGSFWVGAALGSLLTIPLLDPKVVDPALGWRLAFGLGAVLAIGILVVRRHVPESPRWLFIHGREDEGEEIVRDIEETVHRESHHELPEVHDDPITIRQRRTISIPEIAKTVFTLYPKRTVLCLSLFVGQAFLYNAFFFTYGDALTTFFDVKQTGWYLAVFAVSNFLGALLLSRLFDTIGRVKMITGTYILSGVLLAVAGMVLGSLNATTLTLFGVVIFFFASAGASAAYLTASEVFPLETRALCIAFFYAIGTAVGGISGPLLFGALIDSASKSKDITAPGGRLLPGRGPDGGRRRRGGLPRGQGGGPVAREHRPAPDGRGGRHGRHGSEPVGRLSSTGTSRRHGRNGPCRCRRRAPAPRGATAESRRRSRRSCVPFTPKDPRPRRRWGSGSAPRTGSLAALPMPSRRPFSTDGSCGTATGSCASPEPEATRRRCSGVVEEVADHTTESVVAQRPQVAGVAVEHQPTVRQRRHRLAEDLLAVERVPVTAYHQGRHGQHGESAAQVEGLLGLEHREQVRLGSPGHRSSWEEPPQGTEDSGRARPRRGGRHERGPGLASVAGAQRVHHRPVCRLAPHSQPTAGGHEDKMSHEVRVVERELQRHAPARGHSEHVDGRVAPLPQHRRVVVGDSSHADVGRQSLASVDPPHRAVLGEEAHLLQLEAS